MKGKMKLTRLLSFLLTLVLVVGLLPTGLFTIEVKAADTVDYDSTTKNFTFDRATANTSDDLTDDFLLVRGYKGTATAIQIPDTVSVDNLGTTLAAQYKAAGVETLSVRFVMSHFSSTTALTHVRLGANIEQLYDYAFVNIKETLVDVDIPYNSNLQTIGSNIFCASLTGSAALERIGMTTADGTKTDRLPASVSFIRDYAFYHTGSLKSIDLSLTTVDDLRECTFTDSGISSIVLPTCLDSIGWSVFSGCRNLTTLTFPETMVYIGPYAFQDCTALTKLVLKCGVSGIGESGGGTYLSLWGINPDCTVYVPQPADADAYNDVVRLLYSHMGASASVKLRWLDSSGNEMTISPKTAPSAKSNSVVTLSGTYNDAAYSGFTYDYQDSDGDGLGAVIVLDGKLTNNLTLKLDGSYAGNTSQVLWHVVDAYSRRRGTDEYGFDVLRGTELTEAMVRTQALGYTKQENAKTTVSTSLRLANASAPGIYYYIPTLINCNDSYVTGSGAQSAVFLPPVMVVYRPETGDLVNTTIKGSTTASLNIDNASNTCELSSGMQVQVPGFDAWLYDSGDFVNGVTEAKSTDGTASITYRWYKTDTKTNTGGTAIATKYGCGGKAVYGGYDRAGGTGIYWRCGGLSESYIAHLKATAKTRTEYFYMVVTITANGKSTTITSDPCELNLYINPEITGFVADESEAPAGNITAGVATDGSIAINGTITMKKGATNVMFTPNFTGAPDEGAFTGSVVTTWTCSGNGNSNTYTGSCFLSDWLPTTAGTYGVTCKVELQNASGNLVGRSVAKYFRVKVTDEKASVFAELPVFDVTEQSKPQFIGLQNTVRYTDISVHLTQNVFGKSVGSTYTPGDNPTIFEVYMVDSADQNRGGTLLFTCEGANGKNNSSDYELDGNKNSERTDFRGTFKLYFGNWLDTDHKFSDYGAEYYYVKAINKKNGTTTGVAYSPTFPVIPTAECVPEGTEEPQRSWEVTYHSNETTWAQKNGSADVTLNVVMELQNIPLAEYVDRNTDVGDSAHVLYWQYYDNGEKDWRDLYLYGTTGIYCTYDTMSYTTSGRDYTVKGRTLLDFDASVFADDSDWSYLWEGNEDGTIKLRLIIDPDSVYTRAEDDIYGYTNPQEAVQLEIVRVENAVPSIGSGHMSGGREYPQWDGSTGTYKLITAASGDYSVIPYEEYWLFSDRYDGKTEDRYGNKPGSEKPIVLNGFRYASSGVHAVVWQLELADGTKQLITIGDEITYDSGDASYDGTWPAYENKARVEYGAYNSIFALTIDPPTGAKAFVMKATPIAVVLKDSTGSATDTANWAVAKAGTTYTIRINPVTTATAASVYGSGRYYFNLEKSELPYTISANVSSPDDSVVTCQWYRRSDSSHCDPESDTPVGAPIVMQGRETLSLDLTKEVLQAFASEDGSGTAYFYLCADSYYAHAIYNKTARATGSFYQVSVNNDYLVAEKPVITPAYNSTDPVYVLYGNEEPEAMRTVTVEKATSACSQSIYINYIMRDPKTGEMLLKSSRIAANIVTDENGNCTTTGTNGAALKFNDDGTVTCTVDRLPYIGSSITANGVRYYDYDLEFCWYVRNQLSGNLGSYATGGNITTARSVTYTVEQRRAERPTLRNADRTQENVVTLDSNAQTDAIPYADIDPSIRAGLGLTGGEEVPAFLQSSDYYAMRPFGYVPSFSDDAEKSGDTLLAWLEYYDTTKGEDGSPKGWTAVGSSGKPCDSAGNVLNVDYAGYCKYLQTPGEANYFELWDIWDGADDGYHFCPNDPQIFLRVAVTAKNGEYTYSASDPAYSRPFALVRVAVGTDLDAESPVYTGSEQSFFSFTWNQDDSTVQSHSFGEDSWVIGEDGTGEGVLSYRWQRVSYAANDNYVDITDNDTAATPVLTVSRAEIEAWAKDTAHSSNGRPQVLFKLVVTNTNNDPSITGKRTVEAVKYVSCSFGAAPATPAATATVNGYSAATATAGNADLTASVSVTGQGGDTLDLSNVTYQWKYRVVSATTVEGTTVVNPDAAWNSAEGSSTASTYSIPTSNSANVGLMVPYDEGGTTATKWSLVSGDSLWKEYQSVTVEYRCKVKNTEGTESVTGYSNTVTVTLSAPTFDLTVSGKDSDGSTALPLRVTENRTVTLSVPQQEGCTYQWRYTNSLDASYYYTLPDPVTSDAASLTITTGNYTDSRPYYFCQITHTASGIMRETERFYVGKENTDGTAVKPVISKNSGSVTCDVGGAAEKSFSFTATAPDGGVLSYQWQEYRGDNWTDIAGATTASLALAGYDTVPCNRNFRCVVTNTKGGKTAENEVYVDLTVRGVVLNDVLFIPVAGVAFETTLTATVYGLRGKSVAWSIADPASGYTLTAAEDTVSSSVATVTATLRSDDPQEAKLNITATVDGTYQAMASVYLTTIPFSIDTNKITCTMGEEMTPFTIETTGTRPGTGWSWAGDIPDGLSIDPDSGIVSGTPTVPGAYQVSLKNGTTEKGCTIIVKSPAADKATSDSGYLLIGGKSTVLRSDLSGTGWSWSSEAAVLTLDSSYTDGNIRFSSNNSMPLYIRMKGDVAVNGTIYCWSGSPDLYLYGSGSLTVTSPDDAYYAIHMDDGTLYDRRAEGDLTVTNSYTGIGSSLAVEGSIDGAGSAGSVTIKNEASAAGSYGVRYNVTCTGSNEVSITASIAEGGTAAYGVYGSLTQNGSGPVTVTVNSSANAPSQYIYGVIGTLTQNGSGAVTVTVNQNAGQIGGLYGAQDVVLNSDGPVTITADGNGYANYVNGTRTLTTTGTVSAEITGRNGTTYTEGAYSITLGHTGGSVKLNAAGTAEAVYSAPTDTTGYIVSGAPDSGTVTYTAATNAVPIFTVGGTPLTPDASGNASYLLSLQQGEKMETLSITAYCNGGCTLAFDASGKPNGVEVTMNNNVITVSGTPGSNAETAGSFTITATSTDGTQTVTLTINWTMSDLKLLVGPYSNWFDTNGNYQVRAGQAGQAIYVFVVGEKPAKLQLFDGANKLCEWSDTYYSKGQIYSVDSAATQYTDAYSYRYTMVDASGMDVGDTKTLTVKALDEDGNLLQALNVTVTAVDPDCPTSISFNGNYGYYNLGLYDYAGDGWTWSKNNLRLSLNGYNSSNIRSEGGPLNLYVQQSSSLSAIYAYAGLNITGATGQTLTVNYTGTNAALTLNGSALTVDTDGSVSITSAGKVLDSVSVFKLGSNVQMLRMEGLFDNALEPTFDALTGSYYLYNGTANASETPGVFLYGIGSNIPDFTVTIDGGTAATVGDTVTLTARIPDELTAAHKFNSEGVDQGLAFEITYQWASSADGTAWTNLDGRTASTLTPSTALAGSTQYRCTVTVNGTSQTSDAHILTVSPAGVTVSGTATSFNSDTDEVIIQLTESGAAEAAYEAVVKGNTAVYSIEGVASGTYTLKVMKKNHVTREYTITVGSSNVVRDVKICLLGDVTGDGKVNMKDINMLYDHFNKVNLLTGYAFLCGDVNADGKINIKDVNKVVDHFNKVATLW